MPRTALTATASPVVAQRYGWGAEAVLELGDDGGKAGAVMAAGEMSSRLCHLGRRGLSVEHDRQRAARPAARPAVGRAQLVPVRAGVCGAALSRRRSQWSQELVRRSRVSDMVERASRASTA
jgi:hypothetical protein